MKYQYIAIFNAASALMNGACFISRRHPLSLAFAVLGVVLTVMCLERCWTKGRSRSCTQQTHN